MVQFKNIQKKVLPCDEIWAFVVIWATESEFGDVLVAIFTAKKITLNFNWDEALLYWLGWQVRFHSAEQQSYQNRHFLAWILKVIVHLWFFGQFLLIMLLETNAINVSTTIISSDIGWYLQIYNYAKNEIS